MKLFLDHLIPNILKEKIEQSDSDIWNKAISFENPEFVKIEAPSGSGKTTLTHLLYKVRQDYSGNIFYDNKQLIKIKEKEIATHRSSVLSIVFQDLRLFPELTARENIEIKRLNQPNYRSVNDVQDMAIHLKVEHILNQKIGLCSLGEQQRIAIIRSLMQPFSWLILDEPFSHLDNQNIKASASLIESVCKQNKAGIILMGLNPDSFFNYSRTFKL